MADDGQVREDALDVVTEPTELAAGRVVFDWPAFDVRELLADGGAGK